MKTYQATAIINATPQHIWDVLIDTDRYADWDPGMIRIEGRLALGERVKFFTKFSPEKAFPVKVTGYQAAQRMVLTGGMPLGLFKSERTHTLEPIDATRTKFHTEEIFSGLLLPLFGKQIPDLTDSFENFVAGLKQQAEAIAQG